MKNQKSTLSDSNFDSLVQQNNTVELIESEQKTQNHF
jgi:hypothetical protein